MKGAKVTWPFADFRSQVTDEYNEGLATTASDDTIKESIHGTQCKPFPLNVLDVCRDVSDGFRAEDDLCVLCCEPGPLWET